MRAPRRALESLAWLAAAVVIALGAAGLVTAMDATPEGGNRPELTARGDATVTPALDAAEADLRRMAADLDALSREARTALAALNGTDLDSVDAAVRAGDELVLAIRTRAAAVTDALGEVPLIGTPEADYQVSEAVRDRHAALVRAAAATGDLDAAWIRLTTGSLAASRLSAHLAAHDAAVVEAAERGRAADYDGAMTTLDAADAALEAARRQRDQLVATVDVTVLGSWLDRNADYDRALRALYLALRDVGGRVTDDVRDAIAGEREAKDRLPPDSRGLILIMSDIGRGGMNSAVITIEQIRGALAEALTEAGPAATPESAPAGSPGASPETLTPPP